MPLPMPREATPKAIVSEIHKHNVLIWLCLNLSRITIRIIFESNKQITEVNTPSYGIEEEQSIQKIEKNNAYLFAPSHFLSTE